MTGSPDELFDNFADELAVRGATTGAMFGKRALKAGGTAFACLKGDLLAFRLGAGTPEHAQALALAGTEPFDPAGNGRPFRDWVAVPATHSARWRQLAESALARPTS